MTVREHATDAKADGEPVYRCPDPDCDGGLQFVRRSWRCVDCGHVPKHGTD